VICQRKAIPVNFSHPFLKLILSNNHHLSFSSSHLFSKPRQKYRYQRSRLQCGTSQTRSFFIDSNKAHSDYITSVLVTSDNRYIVSGSGDKTIAVWDIADKKHVHRFEQAHSDYITSVAVTSDNRYIVSSGLRDKTIAVWDVADKKLLHRFEQAHSHYIRSVAVTSDNR